MLLKDFRNFLNKLDGELEVVIKYGNGNQVSDPYIEFVAFDSCENIGEDCYLICCGETNIRDLNEV